MNRIQSFIAATIIFACSIQAQAGVMFETYVTAGQIESLFATAEASEKTIASFQAVNIEKVYLETIRGNEKPSEETLIKARDALLAQGFAVTGAIATIRGEHFCAPSNQPGIWINYQDPKTEEDMAAHFRLMASMFDELMIDDFFATDDASPASIQAKGDQTWPQYRLRLMRQFAEEYVIKPARETNPDVKIILKFPQWYDRFHKFGYDAARSHEIFDRIWVGTETRDPQTKRFGFTMPTMGHNNYAWLKSIVGGKMGGGWFDFGDCTPETYLMQAYQTVLAGADEIVLFEAGSVVGRNPCMEPFINRRDAVKALGAIIQGKTPLGIAAYKPAHSEGSSPDGAANLYVYDYLATLGLPVIPTADINDDSKVIFLPRQAADDPAIAAKFHAWLGQDKTLILTPDFLVAMDDAELFKKAGYDAPFTLGAETKPITAIQWQAGQANARQHNDKAAIRSQNAIDLRAIPMPQRSFLLAAGLAEAEKIPMFVLQKLSKGKIILLNLQTYTHDEFAPGKEQFLPPRPLTIQHWPDELLAMLHAAMPYQNQVHVIAKNNSGVNLFKENIAVFSNYSSAPITKQIFIKGSKGEAARVITLHPSFPHRKESAVLNQADSADTIWNITVPPWDLTVITWDKNGLITF